MNALLLPCLLPLPVAYFCVDFFKSDPHVMLACVRFKLLARCPALDGFLQRTIRLRPWLCRLCEAAVLMHAGDKAVLITANIIRTESFPLLAADLLEQVDADAAGSQRRAVSLCDAALSVFPIDS